MQAKIIITCAVTGNLTTREQHPGLPCSPKEIADSALEAAQAGASIAHIHVRDPETGKPSMELDHYREVMERIREKNEDLILNLTTGPGGRFVPSPDNPRVAGPGTTLLPPEERVAHLTPLRPDICTLDLNTMNSGKEVVINTPPNVRRMIKVINEAGIKPEIELFDTGDIAFCHDLVKEGSLDAPIMCSLVMGVKYGFQPSPETVIYARNLLPSGSVFTGFGVGRHSFPMAAQSVLAGGHVRVGLEDAVYIDRGVLAPSNAALVEKARRMIEDLGTSVATTEDARRLIGLPGRARDLNEIASRTI
ncbi:3-keto-5-aminohexanoate cleavage protein [Chelativorans sp. ZYF759]|uniref:3-keto-5-aminohexanoate cleavage protein n=1 Tax=Chelativorans sp. ZYF759 TaxID=2692213 RepID=UPI00145F5CDC|nr:3-keto-5-aminohexanoate cleavage protein [Chelativorans sp. ZYF759]NMG40669.1 3-keto-5-aminohexanoate cleavage protein [Chelativorans sp. ZYF759]